MIVRNEKPIIEPNIDLMNFILNTNQSGELINKSSQILKALDQSDHFETIVDWLTHPEHLASLKQLASIHQYIGQVGKSVFFDFTRYVLEEINKDSKEEISHLLIALIAIRLMHDLHQSDRDLYNSFAVRENHEQASFDMRFEPVTGKVNQLTYQILFDDTASQWRVKRFSTENNDGQNTDDCQLEDLMENIFSHLRPEALNPFVKKTLHLALQSFENKIQNKQSGKNLKTLFESQYNKLGAKIRKYSLEMSANLPNYHDINCIRTYFENLRKKPKVMAKLFLQDGLFELVNDFVFIKYLIQHLNLADLKSLLEKTSIKLAFLQADISHFSQHTPKPSLELLASQYFAHASQDQLAQAKTYWLSELAMALPKEDFIQHLNQGKIQFEYLELSHYQVALYKKYPEHFESILEGMLASGKIIHELPRDEKYSEDETNRNILRHYVKLFFKHKGRWFHLLSPRATYFNYRFALLGYAMKIDPRQTLDIMDTLAYVDANGNKILPIDINAQGISDLISKYPESSFVLLDYANIINTLRNDSFEVEPYGKIRHFDYLSKILHCTPSVYVEKLLKSGILFAEIGMPHYHHFSGFGFFAGKNPGAFVSLNLQTAHDKLPSATFMSALREGLVNNRNINRLFLKEIINIDLISLAEILQGFHHIKHLELSLPLHEENQINIIKFFDIMKKTHSHLHYHLQLQLSRTIKPLKFITDFICNNDINIKSLVIVPVDTWVKMILTNDKKPKLKNAVDACIKRICENNLSLHQISMNGLSKSRLRFLSGEDEQGYSFTQFPEYNIQIYSMDDTEPASRQENDTETAKLLFRNRNIKALRSVSDTILHFQIILELLPWLKLRQLPMDIIFYLFDILKFQHTMPSKIPHYQAIKHTIEKRQKQVEQNEIDLGNIASSLACAQTMVQSANLHAKYRFKPHKKHIDGLHQFLNIGKIQEEVITVIGNWFCRDTSQFPDTIRLNRFQLSSHPLICELDGALYKGIDKAGMEFAVMVDKLNTYQKAITTCMKERTRQAYIAFQCHGPLQHVSYWTHLASQGFDGYELLMVLENYHQHQDIYKSDHFLKDNYNKVFTHFNGDESKLFKKIMTSLNKYLKQKDLPRDKQCDRHKHLHKSALFELIKPDNIAIFKKSKPRLYYILRAQRERLALSIATCSVKLTLRHHGLFSFHHQQNKIRNTAVTEDYKEQINKCIL